MNHTEAARKLYNILHDDRFSWTPESVEAFNTALEALANSSETPNNSPTEMSGTFNKDLAMAKILADVLVNPVIVCNKLLGTEWCKEYCKPGAPYAECWMRYAEVVANDQLKPR